MTDQEVLAGGGETSEPLPEPSQTGVGGIGEDDAPAASFLGVAVDGSPSGLRLHHVAVVVRDLELAIGRQEGLGFRGAERVALPEQGVVAATFASGAGYLEVIQPTDPAGAIGRFLAKRGEGLHHVAYGVPNLATALRGLREAGVRLIDEEPRAGAHGWRIAFVHPEACNGVLTELVELDGPVMEVGER